MVKISILTARECLNVASHVTFLCVTLYSIPSLSETSFAALTRYLGSALCKDKRTRFLSFSVESMRINALSLSVRSLSSYEYKRDNLLGESNYNFNYRTHSLINLYN